MKINNKINKRNNRNGEDNMSISKGDLPSEMTRKDIEKSYNLETVEGTEAYYSNRYGWTLRRIVD